MDEEFPQGIPPIEDIERELASRDQENQYLRGRNLALQDATESGFNPRSDANVIEYKLSSDELLERIEHYLRGDILKTRVNEQNQMESYYAIPTKKITVTLFKEAKTNRIYVINEHPTTKEKEEWDVMSSLEYDDKKQLVETQIEENYKPVILSKIKKGLQSKAKHPPIENIGYASKEIQDPQRINLNDYGVQEVMNILSMYITKETFLSWYKEDRIMEILGDLGNALNKFFLINFKIIGLDTEYKKTKYPMMIITILHAVENAYRRALLGQENKGTREGIIISQHQMPNQQFSQTLPVPKKKWNPLDKSTW